MSSFAVPAEKVGERVNREVAKANIQAARNVLANPSRYDPDLLTWALRISGDRPAVCPMSLANVSIYREADLCVDGFQTERCRIIFRTVEKLVDECSLEVGAVAAHLIEHADLDRVGGFSGLMDLHSQAIPGIAIGPLTALLRKLARRRRATRISALLTAELSAGASADDEHILQLAADLSELAAPVASESRIENLPGVSVDCPEIRYIRDPELPESSVVGLTGDSGNTRRTVMEPADDADANLTRQSGQKEIDIPGWKGRL